MKTDNDPNVVKGMPVHLAIGSILKGWESTRSKLIEVANKCDSIAKRTHDPEVASLAEEMKKTALVLVNIGQLLSVFHQYVPTKKVSWWEKAVAIFTILQQ